MTGKRGFDLSGELAVNIEDPRLRRVWGTSNVDFDVEEIMANKEKKLARARAARTGEKYTVALARSRRKHAFHRWLEEVIETGGVYWERWDSFSKQSHRRRVGNATGVLAPFTPEDNKHAHDNTRAELASLLVLLDAASAADVTRMVAIMWIGADVRFAIDGHNAQPSPASFLEKLQNAEAMFAVDGRRSVTRYITTKPLHTYLTNGLRAASRAGFDVSEGFPASRVVDVDPPNRDLEASGKHKIRPFEEVVDRGPGVATTLMHGRVEQGAYVVSVFEQEVTLETHETGADEWGPFAIVNEREYALAGGFTLAVDLEPDEAGFHGCVLSVFQRKGSWIDPGTMFSVYFHSGGTKDGSGGSFVVRDDTRSVN